VAWRRGHATGTAQAVVWKAATFQVAVIGLVLAAVTTR
jgi:hypothetical protein